MINVYRYKIEKGKIAHIVNVEVIAYFIKYVLKQKFSPIVLLKLREYKLSNTDDKQLCKMTRVSFSSRISEKQM